jgi:lipoprotein-releasing system permease protein
LKYIKSKTNWILFIASRYIFKGRGNSPVLSLLGIATGVLALIVIIAVMNGFQLGFIESILEISSYHIRLESIPDHKIPEISSMLFTVPGIRAVIPFREFQALAHGRMSGQQAVLVRGVPENALEQDHVLGDRLDFEAGHFNITDHGNVLLGAELARRLGLGVGDRITIFSILGILSSDDEGGLDTFTVTGIFRTGYYEYDCSWAFININNEFLFNTEDTNTEDIKLGIKIANRFQDRIVLEQIKKKLFLIKDLENIKYSSWRDYNRSFFGALRTEKLFMFILVGLIFIVVGLNIYQAQRRAVLQRREEIGLLRAVGGSENAVRLVFVFDGAIIGFTGAGAGLILGLLIASNIQSFFTLTETIVNFFIRIINILAAFLGAGQAGSFSFFSPAIFYIKEIPSRIIPHEVVIIFLFGFLSALAAAWFASGKAAKIQPAEVMRYE